MIALIFDSIYDYDYYDNDYYYDYDYHHHPSCFSHQ